MDCEMEVGLGAGLQQAVCYRAGGETRALYLEEKAKGEEAQ